MTECSDPRGHCQHTVDGTPFQRNNTWPVVEVVDIHCCACGATASTKGYAQYTTKSLTHTTREHGTFL